MAQWCSIKVSFDTPVSEETLRLLGEELSELDYDFPVRCLTAGSFVSYRSPLIADDLMAGVFLNHGVEGRWWMSSETDPDQATESDWDCVVFRPDVDLHSISNAVRNKTVSDALLTNAKRYVNITRAFGIPALPVVWEALSHICYVSAGDRERFTENVQALSKGTSALHPPPQAP